MKIPFSHEAVMDVTLRALRAANILADDASADLIRTAAKNLTEAERDNLALSLNYGTIPTGASTLTSPEDVNIFIDDDDTNPTSPYTNVLRLTKGQNTTPVTDPIHELMTVGSESTVPPQTAASKVVLRLGAQRHLFGNNEHAPATLELGGGKNSGGTEFNWGQLRAGENVLGTRDGVTLEAGSMTTSRVVGLVGSNIAMTDALRNVGGGFATGPGTNAAITQMYIGDFLTNPAQTFSLGRWLSPYDVHKWWFGANENTTENVLFLSGLYPDGATVPTPRLQVAVSGSSGQQHLDPTDLLVGGNPSVSPLPHEAQFMVVSPAINERRCALHTFHRAATVPSDTHLVNFHSNVEIHPGADSTIRLLSVTAPKFGTADRYTVFSVNAIGRAYCLDGFHTGAGDLAEYFKAHQTKDNYADGSVVIMDAGGALALSNSVADTRAVGVVSTKPGMTLANPENSSENDEFYVPLAMAGTVPVKVSTAEGNIMYMDLLVSGPEGRAVKAPEDAPVGSIIGKAMEQLEGEDTTGTIKMLVLNR